MKQNAVIPPHRHNLWFSKTLGHLWRWMNKLLKRLQYSQYPGEPIHPPKGRLQASLATTSMTNNQDKLSWPWRATHDRHKRLHMRNPATEIYEDQHLHCRSHELFVIPSASGDPQTWWSHFAIQRTSTNPCRAHMCHDSSLDHIQ